LVYFCQVLTLYFYDVYKALILAAYECTLVDH
jgi:hypothetical protein